METIVRNLDLMNKLRSKAFTIAGVTDQKESYFESQRNIAKEVVKIRALIRQKNTCILAKIPHTDINKIKLLSEDLEHFHQISINNLNENAPKVLKQEQSKPKIVYSTLEEQKESEKIENLTILELKTNILNLLQKFRNKTTWMELYKNKLAGKTKSTYMEFLSSLNEIVEDIDTATDINFLPPFI